MPRCGNCNIDLPSKRALVVHNILVHDSPFLDGDAELIALSKEIEATPESKQLKQLLKGVR